MKAHDSWPGNKAEEGRLPNSTHTLRRYEQHTAAYGTKHNIRHVLSDSRMVP